MSTARVAALIARDGFDAGVARTAESLAGQTLGDVDMFTVGGTGPPPGPKLAGDEDVAPTPGGPAPAFDSRNRALGASAAPYVCTLLAGDVLSRTALARAAGVLDADPAVAFVAFWAAGVDDVAWRPGRCDLDTVLEACPIARGALVRAEAVRVAGGFDETLPVDAQDWDLWIRILAAGGRGTILQETLLTPRPGTTPVHRRARAGSDVEVERRLIEKHQALYAARLVPLVAHRESGIGRLLAEIHDLDAEYHGHTAPAIRTAREELEAVREKRDRFEWAHSGATAAGPPPEPEGLARVERGWIDLPADGAVVGRDVLVRGWAIWPAGVLEVRVLLDNEPWVRRAPNEVRPDVMAAHPEDAGACRGWSFTERLPSRVADGDHRLDVRLVDRGGAMRRVGVITVTVRRGPRRARGPAGV